MRYFVFFVLFLAACGGAPAARDVSSRFVGAGDAIRTGDYPETTSVLVLRGGAISYEDYFNEGGPETLNNTRSATKSVTALAIGAAIGDGLIGSVDDRASSYFPEGHPMRDGGAKEAITIADLLSMSSAFVCNDSDPESPGNEENMYPLENWGDWIFGLPTDASATGQWRYCTAGVVLLGKVIEQASGEKADAYIERRVLQPLGISRQAWFYSEAGEAMTGGGLELTARDLGKLARLILDEGRWEGEEIVPAAFIRDALSIQRQANERQDYGYLFWRRDYETACGAFSGWYMAGNGGNAVVMFKDLDAAIVVTRTRYNTRGMHDETIDLIERHLLPPLSCEK